MLKLIGTMTSPTSGKTYPVNEVFDNSAKGNEYLCAMSRNGYTAELACTVLTGAGSVTYKVTV